MEVRGGPGVSWGPRWPKGVQMSEKDVKRDFVTPPRDSKVGLKLYLFLKQVSQRCFFSGFLGTLEKGVKKVPKVSEKVVILEGGDMPEV